MTGNTFGTLFKITTFGESHGKSIGVIIDGCPSRIKISEEIIQKELDKRKPGQNLVSSLRNEDDLVEIKSGVFNGITTGTPIFLEIKNKDQDSTKYELIKDKFRPGHADFTYHEKYGIRDYKGGGRSSARETATRVAAGAIAKHILSQIANKKIEITAYTIQIGNIKSKKENQDFNEIQKNSVKCADKEAAKQMEELILFSRKEGDSIGGIVEVIIKNCPIGLGEPVFDRLNAKLAHALFSIGAVKGVEFGKGFEVATMRGSENNDQISKKGFLTNNAGGILGGISNGEDIIIRVAVKPTPSILKKQRTITTLGEETEISVEGRHDPCIVPRIIPVIESMISLVILDNILIANSKKWK